MNFDSCHFVRSSGFFSRGVWKCFPIGLAVVLYCALAGCMAPPIDDPVRTGPYYSAANLAGESQLPATLRRVVLLPAAGGAVIDQESVAALDAVFVTELQKQNRFEIVPLTRAECNRRFHVQEFSSTGALPHDFLAILQRDYGADAVMFIDITVFKPYRPLALGVRSKLATVGDDVRLLWTFDNVFSATDERVANAARRHFLKSDRQGVPADFTQGVLQSPTRFATYVASEMFGTLPPVYSPPKPVPAKGTEK